MGGLKSEDLLNGDYIAIHRNKLLAEAFYLRGDIEKFGTGFFRIREALKDLHELSFSIEVFDEFTKTGIVFNSKETEQVKLLLRIFSNNELSVVEMLERLRLKHRPSFLDTYLKPSLNNHLIEMTIPDKPNSKYQKYRLTEKGKKLKGKLERVVKSNE